VEFSGNNLAHFSPTNNTFQEWAIPTVSSQPLGTTTTVFSGQLEIWGTEYAKDKIFVFTPSDSMFREFHLPTPNSGVEYVSIEPSGTYVRAWFNEIMRNAIGEIIYTPTSPNSGTLYEDTLPAGAGGGVNGIVAGPGVVWFEGVSGIVKWDRASGQYTVWPLPTHGSAQGDFIALDSLGQAWYTEGVQAASGADNYVGVLRGDNTIKEWQIPTIGADPRVISIDPLTQHPWTAENSANAGNGKVAELDPSAGGSVVAAAPVTSPSGLAALAISAAASGAVVSSNVVSPTSAPNIGALNGQFTEFSIGTSTQPHDVELVPTVPDFSLSASPSTISVAQGGSGTVTITGVSQESFSGTVALSVTGSVPTGVGFSVFDPNPISIPSGGTASANLAVNIASDAAPGTSAITIGGTGSSGTHTTSFSLTIT
jgi:hypothetical protein